MGDGLYKDLITNNIYQDKKIGGMFFTREGQKVNYNNFSDEEFNRALEYPIYMNPRTIIPVTDQMLLDIYSKVSSVIQEGIISLQEAYENRLLQKMAEENNRKQKSSKVYQLVRYVTDNQKFPDDCR